MVYFGNNVQVDRRTNLDAVFVVLKFSGVSVHR